MKHHRYFPESNPFSTRYVRPGAIPYRFSAELDSFQFIDRLAASHWRGAIIGPHGSGKSTLLASILPLLKAHPVDVRAFSLHDGQRALPAGWHAAGPLATSKRILTIIDGYEQLSRWSRIRVSHICQHRGWGLLVTAHRRTRLPTLLQTAPAVETLQQIVEQIQSGHVRLITHGDVANAFQKSTGNLREALFELYDRYEERRILEPSARSIRRSGITGSTLPVV